MMYESRYHVDASVFYALLRFEEAAEALRATLQLHIVDTLADRVLTEEEFSQEFGFQPLGTRTFGALLKVMQVLEPGDGYAATATARRFLASSAEQTRSPYLSMGANADSLIAILRGQITEAPLYAAQDEASLMEDAATTEVAEQVAYGLASRARAFADPLADAIHAGIAAAEDVQFPKVVADLGAGSPYVAMALARRFQNAELFQLVDRKQGLMFAARMLDEAQGSRANGDQRLSLVEGNIFNDVPAAELYCLSNTAHDWLPAQYLEILNCIRPRIADGGCLVIHEPLLETSWQTTEQWHRALWMACYALTLFKLTGGQGTCYSLSEHDQITAEAGFMRFAEPAPTVDGCTALLYRPT